MNKILLLTLSGWVCATSAVLAQNTSKAEKPSEALLQKALEAVDKGVSQAAKAKAQETATEVVSRATAKKSPTAAAKPETEAPKKKEKREKDETQRVFIDSEGVCELLSKEGVAIFREKVAVNRHDLKIWCGELEIHVDREDEKKTGASKRTEEPVDPTVLDTKDIKKAIARAKGNGTVVIWRKTEGGETVSNCQEAVYDGATGQLTLKGKPKVLRNVETYFFGTKDSDTITVNQSNEVKGNFKVLRMPQKEALAYREGLFAQVPGYQTKGKVAADLESEPAPDKEKEPAAESEAAAPASLPQ